MDEKPITGQPGDFHLSTTGRDKDKLVIPPANKVLSVAAAKPGVSSIAKLDTDIPAVAKGAKSDKSPKTPGSGAPKPRRRKSKAAGSGGATPK